MALNGGSAHNAIPREASVTIVAATADLDTLKEALQCEGDAACAEFSSADPQSTFEIKSAGSPGDAWDEASTKQVLTLLTALPHGIVRTVYREVSGIDPEVGTAHAGLECGIIGEKYPGMDMISVGPQIEFPYSPDERIKVGTVLPFFKVLTATLERLAG